MEAVQSESYEGHDGQHEATNACQNVEEKLSHHILALDKTISNDGTFEDEVRVLGLAVAVENG